jgi:hypothetical protein
VLGRNPSHTDALQTLGDIEHKLGLLTQAVDTLQRVLHTPGIEPFTVRVMPVPPMSGAFKCQPVASHSRVYVLVLAPLLLQALQGNLKLLDVYDSVGNFTAAMQCLQRAWEVRDCAHPVNRPRLSVVVCVVT